MKETAYDWLKNIIHSCNQPFHLDCAIKLVECFKERFGECQEFHQLLDDLNRKQPMITII